MIKKLELKIPPPIVFIICAIYIFLVRNIEPILPFGEKSRVIVGGIFIITGLAFDMLGVMAFGKYKTSVNPMNPYAAHMIVYDGIYKFTRNPMYLGLSFVLLGWCVVNLSCYGFLAVPAFIKYIEVFQIKPEERILSDKFPQEYIEYTNRVRRWL